MDWKPELVVVPVTDVERAKRFYSEQLGFAVDHTRVGDRWNSFVFFRDPDGNGSAIQQRPAG